MHYPEVSRELQLAACTAIAATEQQSPLLRESYRDIDWPRFLHLVRIHRIAVLVHAGLAARQVVCPPPIAGALAAHARQDVCAALTNVAELIRVARMLEEQGLASLSIKGPVLSLELYGDPTIRQSIDLDLLLAPGTQAAAGAVMDRLGYRVARRVVRGATEVAATHVHPERGLKVDLSWSLARHPSAFGLSFERMMGQAHAVGLLGARIHTLSREDHLLYLCHHGARHRWGRLKWLCDVAQIMRRNDIVDWSGLLRRARDLGIDRAVLQAGRLAATMFAIPLAKALVATGDRTTETLVRYALGRLATEQDMRAIDSDRFELALYTLRHQRRWSGRWQLLRHLGRRRLLTLTRKRLSERDGCLTIQV